MVAHKTIIRLFHFDSHSECVCVCVCVCVLVLVCVPASKLIFYYNLFLLTMLGFFKCQMSKESLIILSNVLFHTFTKLKQ